MDTFLTVVGNPIVFNSFWNAVLKFGAPVGNKDADAVLIMTEWPQFRTPEFEVMDVLLKNKVIFDGRNLYELDQMKELGYTYYSVGREAVK